MLHVAMQNSLNIVILNGSTKLMSTDQVMIVRHGVKIPGYSWFTW